MKTEINERRLNEEDKLAILIDTEEGTRIIETCKSIEDLREKYKSYISFSQSSLYPKNTAIPFAASFQEKIPFEGKLEFRFLTNKTIFEKPWKPKLREILLPFIGSREYLRRGENYFYEMHWPLMSQKEMLQKEKEDPIFSNSEQRVTWKKCNKTNYLLAFRDVAFLYATLGLLIESIFWSST